MIADREKKADLSSARRLPPMPLCKQPENEIVPKNSLFMIPAKGVTALLAISLI